MDACASGLTYGGVILEFLISFLKSYHKKSHQVRIRKDLRKFKMAPSVAETVSEAADQIHEKLSLGSKASDVKPAEKPEDGPAPAVQAPPVETQHKEPLKLSGALDHFESFDVTPTIGREFVGVNLAKWLKAPNSDELIRDLAITSKPFHLPNSKLF